MGLFLSVPKDVLVYHLSSFLSFASLKRLLFVCKFSNALVLQNESFQRYKARVCDPIVYIKEVLSHPPKRFLPDHVVLAAMVNSEQQAVSVVSFVSAESHIYDFESQETSCSILDLATGVLEKSWKLEKFGGMCMFDDLVAVATGTDVMICSWSRRSESRIKMEMRSPCFLGPDSLVCCANDGLKVLNVENESVITLWTGEKSTKVSGRGNVVCSITNDRLDVFDVRSSKKIRDSYFPYDLALKLGCAHNNMGAGFMRDVFVVSDSRIVVNAAQHSGFVMNWDFVRDSPVFQKHGATRG
jgi:hypothetical protein